MVRTCEGELGGVEHTVDPVAHAAPDVERHELFLSPMTIRAAGALLASSNCTSFIAYLPISPIRKRRTRSRPSTGRGPRVADGTPGAITRRSNAAHRRQHPGWRYGVWQ